MIEKLVAFLLVLFILLIFANLIKFVDNFKKFIVWIIAFIVVMSVVTILFIQL